MAREREIRVGLIADTHGLLRPQARSFLLDSDLIVHAGDIGARGILEELRSIAPVSAVRGNNDTEPWAAHLPEAQWIDAGGVRVYVIHNLAELSLEPAAAGVQVIDFGPFAPADARAARRGALRESRKCRTAALQAADRDWRAAHRRCVVSARIVNLEDERLLVASTP